MGIKSKPGPAGRKAIPAIPEDAENRNLSRTFNDPSADNFIRKWRAFRKIPTQGELAVLSGLTRATISRLESGGMPWRKEQLDKLALVLNCTAADLIGTDPFLEADVFKIFRRIPAKKRDAALKALARLSQ